LKWKPNRKRILLIVWAILFLLSLTSYINSSYYPGTKTYKSGTNWRPNPTWKSGLNTTYTLKQDFQFQNISFPNKNFVAMKDNVAYWINVTSGSNARINIWQWFTSQTTVLEYTTTGTYTTQVYVGNLGAPTVTGADSSSYDTGTHIVTFTTTPSSSQFVYLTWGTTYSFMFYGVYNETTGILMNNGSTVTAYYTDGTAPTTFTVNGSYSYSSTHRPEYFGMLLPSGKTRQYWLGETEVTGSIYIFDDDLTTYYLLFLDLAGVLPDQPYVYAEYYVNGSLYIVEKRKVDVETKLTMHLKLDRRYTLSIVDGSSYTFGELLTTTSTTITLTLRGIDFPKETLLIYKYVRIYGLRGFGTPTGNISITYQDTLNMTNNVNIDINYRNGTNAYTTLQTADSFIMNWLNAANDTDYQIIATIDHQRYGTYLWKQFMPRTYTTNPWVLGWLGILPFDLNNLIAIFIIIVVGASFSMLNPAIGAFLATVVAAALTLMGWLPIAPGFLITAFCFSIMFGIIWARKKVTYG
jgi:hypothetical protein